MTTAADLAARLDALEAGLAAIREQVRLVVETANTYLLELDQLLDESRELA